MFGIFCQLISCPSSFKGYMCKRVHAFTTSFSFLLRRSGTAPLGISTTSLVLPYAMAFCRVSAERAGNAGVGAQDLSMPAGSSQPAGGCAGRRVWELQSCATSVAVLPPPSCERAAEGLFASPEKHYTLFRNVCCYCEVTNFEPKAPELTFCKTLGFGSSPFLSFPKIHSLCCLTWKPIDIHILAEL